MSTKVLLIGLGLTSVLGMVVCAGLGFLLVGSIFALTQPLLDASEEFLGLVRDGKTAEAYAATASGFRAQQDEASFTAAVKQLGLTNNSSTSWASRQFENRLGKAEGVVTSTDGSTTPVLFELIHEGGKWKVVGIRWGGVDLATIKAPMM